MDKNPGARQFTTHSNALTDPNKYQKKQELCNQDNERFLDFRPNRAERVGEKVFGNDTRKKYKDNKIIKF
ncbi:hypothetical protein HpRN190_12910 [Helicobacter pylori]